MELEQGKTQNTNWLAQCIWSTGSVHLEVLPSKDLLRKESPALALRWYPLLL